MPRHLSFSSVVCVLLLVFGWMISASTSWRVLTPPLEYEERSEGRRCHGSLGCFIGMNIFGIDEFPNGPKQISLQIKLYTRRNPESPRVFSYSHTLNASTCNSFNASRATKVIVHGFGGSCDKPWAMTLRRGLLNKEDLNVFCVDWRNGAIHPYYSQASANTQIVAKMLSIFLKGINSSFGNINYRLHMIGFSLGAHICGLVGNELSNIHRITGLDPAGPIFYKLARLKKLDPSDAEFVDVIHSNGKGLLSGGLGSTEPSGTIDFYPNGGKEQLGCPGFVTAQISNIFRWVVGAEKLDRTCNHRRAVEIFTESLKTSTCQYKAFPCNDWKSFLNGECFDSSTSISIGDTHVTKNENNVSSYFLSTRPEMPFCGRQVRITVNYSTEYGSETLYKGSLSLTFVHATLNQEETFVIMRRFYAPGVFSKVIALEWNSVYEHIYLDYNQQGFGLLVNVIKSRRFLKINSVVIQDGHSGFSSTWMPLNASNIIESGIRKKLSRTET